MNKTSKIISGIIILLIIGGGAFWTGMNYGKSQAKPATGFAGNFSAMRGSRTGAGASGAGFILGSIISSDSNSITLQLPSNGGSKIIFYSNATQISKTASGSATDLAVGTTISVTGTTNSDGSVTASSIQIRPAGQNRPVIAPAAGQ